MKYRLGCVTWIQFPGKTGIFLCAAKFKYDKETLQVIHPVNRTSSDNRIQVVLSFLRDGVFPPFLQGTFV